MIRSKRLRFYLILYSVLMSIVSNFFLVGSFNEKVNHFMEQQMVKTSETYLRQSVSIVQRNLDEAKNLMKRLESNTWIHAALSDYQNHSEISAYQRYQISQGLKDYLRLAQAESPIVDDIILITDKGQYSSKTSVLTFKLLGASLPTQRDSTTLLTQESFLKSVRLKNTTMINVNIDNLLPLKNRVFFGTNIFNLENQFLGMLIVVVDNDFLSNNLLVNERHKLTYQNQIIYEGEHFVQNNSHHGNVLKEVAYPYNIEISYRMVNKPNRGMKQHIVILFIAGMGLYLIVYYLVSKFANKIISPIKKLLEWMEGVNSKQVRTEENIKMLNRHLSLRDRVFVYFLMTSLVPILFVSLLYFGLSQNQFIDEMHRNKYETIEAKSFLIDDELNRLKRVLALLKTDRRNFLVGQLIGFDVEQENQLNTLDEMQWSIMNNDGQILLTSTSKVKIGTKLKQLFLENKESNYFYGILETEDLEELFSVGLLYRESGVFSINEPTYLVLSVDKTYFQKLPSIDQVVSESIVIDNYLWNFKNEPLNLITNSKKEVTLDSSHIDYLVNYDISELSNNLKTLYLSHSYFFVIVILALFIFSHYFTNFLLKPFEIILSTRDYEESYPLLIDEVEDLRIQFENKVNEINRLAEEKWYYEKEIIQTNFEKKEIQLFALQNQVNPHFLYNALENLLFLVESKDTERAMEMIVSLSRFFQFVTNREHNLINVKEEIEYSQNYINIMKLRFENFDVEWDIDIETLNDQIMKLILQPLIENCIHHGVRYQDDFVQIKVRICRFMENGLLIEVCDDARGIANEKLKEINSHLQSSTFNRSGLYNVNDRLKLYYGDNVEMNISSQSKQTEVKIMIKSK